MKSGEADHMHSGLESDRRTACFNQGGVGVGGLLLMINVLIFSVWCGLVFTEENERHGSEPRKDAWP